MLVLIRVVIRVQSTALCLSSDKGTIHIFGLTQEQAQQEKKSSNRQSTLSFMKDILPSYFSSEWSAAQFHVPEAHSISYFEIVAISFYGYIAVRMLVNPIIDLTTANICAFGSSPNSVIVVCADGTCYKYICDIGKGECKQVKTRPN